MGLRLSMLHHHSPTNDRDPFKPVKPFVKGQGPASALLEASLKGPFPTYSVTEDYALSLELKKAGFKVGLRSFFQPLLVGIREIAILPELISDYFSVKVGCSTEECCRLCRVRIMLSILYPVRLLTASPRLMFRGADGLRATGRSSSARGTPG